MILNDNFRIEKIANKILEAEKILKPPIKAEEIADFVYDLNFEEKNLNNYSNSGDVLAAIDINNKLIIINSSKKQELYANEGRKNFTIAHELGHYVLHRDITDSKFVDLQTKIIFCREVGNFNNKIERQADLFAVYLLMPERMVRNEYSKIKEPFNEKNLKQLADKFCVSMETMKIRLWRELNLIYVDKSGNYYRNKAEALEAGGQQKLF